MSNQEIQSILSGFNTNMSCLNEHINNLSHMDQYSSSSDKNIMIQKSSSMIDSCKKNITRMKSYDEELAKTMEEQLRQAEGVRDNYL